jgi:hypothetical protein
MLVTFAHELVSVENTLPDPLEMKSGEMRDNAAHANSWGKVGGLLLGDPADRGDYSLLINDGSGMGSVRIWEATGIDLMGYYENDFLWFEGIINKSTGSVRLVPSMQSDIMYVPIVAPTNLAATVLGIADPLSAEVTLTWDHEVETDDFLRFVVYRDGDEIARPTENTYTDILTEAGTYEYEVSANYDEAESEESEEIEVYWDGTPVTERPFSGMPVEWSIAGLYPNPFNPTLNIVIGMVETAELRVTIHNIMGQQVAQLENGQLSAGFHSFIYDAGTLSSGIYFVRATVPGKMNQLKKVVLMK